MQFPQHLLVVHEEGEKKILLISEGVLNFIQADGRGQLNKVCMGLKLFEKNRDKYSAESMKYRILQSGAQIISPYMTKRRIPVHPKYMLSKCLTKVSYTP
jgi:hypothetical protein